MQVKLERGKAFLEVTNDSSHRVRPKGAIAILDIRSLGYYKIQQGGFTTKTE